MAAVDMLPWGRGFDTSLHYNSGAVDHWSSCNCVDGMCNSPNNGYSHGPNHTGGEHCWAKVADHIHPAPDHGSPAGPHVFHTLNGRFLATFHQKQLHSRRFMLNRAVI